MTRKGLRRGAIAAWVIALACGFALFGGGLFAPARVAADMDKGAFQQGCESGGGSYIENNDGSFQCNLKSGGVIKCPDTKSQCTYSEKLSIANTIRVVGAGSLQAAANPGPTNPTPTPTPAKGRVGVIGLAPVKPGSGNPGPGTTPTPGVPNSRGAAGGISIAPAGGAAQPPAAGNKSGIALILFACPPALPHPLQQTQPPANCSANQNVNNQVTFIVGGPTGELTVHGGGLNLNGLPAGKYQIRMNTPTGYDDPVGYCTSAPYGEQISQPYQQVPVANGSYTFELDQAQVIHCDWYITYDLSKAPAKPAVATPVPAAAATPVP